MWAARYIYLVFRNYLLLKRMTQQRKALNQMKQIYEIIHLVSDDMDSKIAHVLGEATRILDMGFGVLSEISGEEFKILEIFSTGEPMVVEARVMNLQDTCCTLAYQQDFVVALADLEQASPRLPQAPQTFGARAYIGAPYYLKGKKKGCLGFYSREKRLQPFSEAEKNAVVYLSQWVSTVLLQDFYEQQLVDTNHHLRKIVESNKQISYTFSHDFKGPLYNMKALLSFLEIPTTDTNQRSLDLIYDSLNGMTDMIAQVGNFYRMEDDDLQVKFVKLNPMYLMESVLPPYEEAANRKNISVHRHFNEEVHDLELETDPEYLKTIFINLITNALKFSPSGSTVSIRLQLLEGRYLIEVRDQGQGFKREDLSHAFKKFSRLSAQPTGSENSSGLGLYIVKQAADKIGASIVLIPVDEAGGGLVQLYLPMKSRHRQLSGLSENG